MYLQIVSLFVLFFHAAEGGAVNNDRDLLDGDRKIGTPPPLPLGRNDGGAAADDDDGVSPSDDGDDDDDGMQPSSSPPLTLRIFMSKCDNGMSIKGVGSSSSSEEEDDDSISKSFVLVGFRNGSKRTFDIISNAFWIAVVDLVDVELGLLVLSLLLLHVKDSLCDDFDFEEEDDDDNDDRLPVLRLLRLRVEFNFLPFVVVVRVCCVLVLF